MKKIPMTMKKKMTNSGLTMTMKKKMTKIQNFWNWNLKILMKMKMNVSKD
jgi:hypothetical protein